MNPHQTQWLPGILVLAASMFAASLYLLFGRRGQAAAEGEGAADDLEARYKGLIGELKELVANKHLMEAPAFAAEKARLEGLAASVLRARSTQTHEALKTEARAQKAKKLRATGMSPQAVKGIWAVAAVAFFGLLGTLLAQQAAPRPEGGGMTGVGAGAGPMAGGAMGAPPFADPEEQRVRGLFARLNQSPDDLALLEEASGVLVRRQQWDDAEPLVRRASVLDPYSVRTRIYRAVFAALETPSAPQPLAELEHLAETFGDAWDANLFAGLLALQGNQPQRGLTHFDRYLATAPDSEIPPSLRSEVEKLRQDVASPKP